jgi:hypothetical protein
MVLVGLLVAFSIGCQEELCNLTPISYPPIELGLTYQNTLPRKGLSVSQDTYHLSVEEGKTYTFELHSLSYDSIQLSILEKGERISILHVDKNESGIVDYTFSVDHTILVFITAPVDRLPADYSLCVTKVEE